MERLLRPDLKIDFDDNRDQNRRPPPLINPLYVPERDELQEVAMYQDFESESKSDSGLQQAAPMRIEVDDAPGT